MSAGISPSALALAAAEVAKRTSNRAVLVKNQVGNLSIVVDDQPIGHMDLGDGGVEWYDGWDASEARP